MASLVQPRLRVLNKKIFVLPGTRNRFWHVATIGDGLREFMYFVDKHLLIAYIEEITGGHLSKIEDDSLWSAIASFLNEQGLQNMGVPTMFGPGE